MVGYKASKKVMFVLTISIPGTFLRNQKSFPNRSNQGDFLGHLALPGLQQSETDLNYTRAEDCSAWTMNVFSGQLLTLNLTFTTLERRGKLKKSLLGGAGCK